MQIKGHPIENDLKGNLLGLAAAVTSMIGLGSLLMCALAATEGFETDAWWWGSVGTLLVVASTWSWIRWRSRYLELSRLAEEGATFDDPTTVRMRTLNASLARQTVPVVGVLLVIAVADGLVTDDWGTARAVVIVGGVASVFAIVADRRERR